MSNFVTILDRSYLLKGLALYASIKRTCPDFRLWVLGLDEEVVRHFNSIDDLRVVALDVRQFETEALRKVRKARTVGEYSWTLTPFSYEFVFALEPSLEILTYIDADVWLLADPAPILDLLRGDPAANIVVTPHGYAPEYDQSQVSGKYCVQFMPARRAALPILREWQKECLAWCFNRHEDGKFGDQMYLDSWTHKYGSAVRELEDMSLAQGPWNARLHRPEDAIFYHFHGLTVWEKRKSISLGLVGEYRIPRHHFVKIYSAYVAELKQSKLVIGRDAIVRSKGNNLKQMVPWFKSKIKWNENLHSLTGRFKRI